MNEGYGERSDGKTAKQLVDDFCEEHGVDEVLQESARYLVGWGNVFWWIGNTKRMEFFRLELQEAAETDRVFEPSVSHVLEMLLRKGIKSYKNEKRKTRPNFSCAQGL